MKTVRALVSAAAVLLLLAGCTTAQMEHPGPIAVPNGLSHDQVAAAVKTSLVGRGWILTGSTDDSYTAMLTGGGWKATIRTVYDTKQVGIEYVSSTGLDHTTRNGTEIINRHWNWWMHYLSHDIQAHLAAETYGQ